MGKKTANVLFYLSLLLLIFFVSGCGFIIITNPDEGENTITLISPMNGSGYYPTTVFLKWEGPKDKEISSYKVFLSENKENVENESSSALVWDIPGDKTSLKISSLEDKKNYYWKVVGETAEATYESAVWGFSTKNSSDIEYLVGVGEDGLYIFDIKKPVGMAENGEILLSSGLISMKVREIDGSLYAFTIENNEMGMPRVFSVYDITDFSSYTQTASFSGEKELFDIAILDGKAFIAAGYDGIEVYDINDLSRPLSNIPADEYGDYYTKVKVFNINEYEKYVMAISDNDKIMVIEANTLMPATTISFEEDIKINSVFYDGAYLYVVSRGKGLSIYKLEDYNTIDEVSSIFVRGDFTSEEYDVYVNGDYAYIAADSFFAVVDVFDKENPYILSTTKVVGARKIIYSDNKVYLVGDTLGSFSHWLCVVDVSNPYNPELLGTYRTLGGKAVDGSLIDNNFYLADEEGKILKIDVSDPEGIKINGKVESGFMGDKIRIEGNRIFVANSTGYKVFDINNANDFEEIYDSGFIGDGVGVNSIYTYDNDFYVGFNDGRVYIYSQEEPGTVSGTPIDLYDASTGDIYVWENYAYIASYSDIDGSVSNGIYVVDLNKTPTGSYEKFLPFDNVVDMVGKEDKIYLLTSNKVIVLDITNPSSPEILSEDIQISNLPLLSKFKMLSTIKCTLSL